MLLRLRVQGEKGGQKQISALQRGQTFNSIKKKTEENRKGLRGGKGKSKMVPDKKRGEFLLGKSFGIQIRVLSKGSLNSVSTGEASERQLKRNGINRTKEYQMVLFISNRGGGG